MVEADEIFLLFRYGPAISGHGCPEKPELSQDGELRAVVSLTSTASEQLENPFAGADSR